MEDLARSIELKQFAWLRTDGGQLVPFTKMIASYLATKSTPEIVHQEGYDFQQAKENKEQAK